LLAYSSGITVPIARPPRRFWQTSAFRRRYYGRHDVDCPATS
jgi:hypothetical protein